MPLIYERDENGTLHRLYPRERYPNVSEHETVKTPVSPKVTAATGGGAALLALGFILRYYGVDVPEPVIGAAAVIGTFLAGYLTPDRLREVGAVFQRGRGEHRA